MLEAYKLVAERLLDQLAPEGLGAIVPPPQPAQAHVTEFQDLLHAPTQSIDAPPDTRLSGAVAADAPSPVAVQPLPDGSPTEILTRQYGAVARPPDTHFAQAIVQTASNPQAAQLLIQNVLQLQATGMLSQGVTRSLENTATQFGRLN